jgi:hypothetical protein
MLTPAGQPAITPGNKLAGVNELSRMNYL